ncbi:hypothetical protein AAG593_04340 [Citromicrobium bathyomarinum]
MLEEYWLPALLMLGGVLMVATAERQAEKARRKIQSEKDSYFEERRELAAYPSLH